MGRAHNRILRTTRAFQENPLLDVNDDNSYCLENRPANNEFFSSKPRRDSEWDSHDLFNGSIFDGSVIRGTVDAVVCVQIFMAGDLEEGSTSLAAGKLVV